MLAVRRHRWSPANHYVTLETKAGANTVVPLQELEEEEEKAYPFRQHDYIIGKQKLDTLIKNKNMEMK